MTYTLVITIAFALMIVLPTFLVFALRNHQKALKITTIVFSVVYFVFLFIGTTCVLNVSIDNFSIGFDFTKPWFKFYFILFELAPSNTFINLSMFLPLGFIVYVFAEKKQFKKTIIFAICLSLFVEFYQFALPIYRNTELTDILFNTLSGLISALYCHYLYKGGAFKPKSFKR